MDFYYNIVSSSPAAGYDGPDFVAANDDSNYESDTHTYQETLISIPDSTQSEEESEGGLFVEQERSISPASAITVASLSASASTSEQEDSSSEISSSSPASESSSEAESDRDYFFDNERADVDWEQALERELEAQPDDHSIGGDSEGTVHQPDPDALHPRLNEHRHPFLLEEDLHGQPGRIEVEDYDVDENEDEDDLDAFEEGLVDLAVVRLHVEEEEEGDGGDDDDDEVDNLQAEARNSFAQQFPHHHHHHRHHHHHHHHHLHHHHAQQRPSTLRFSSLLDVRNLGPRSASPAQLESPHRMPGMADELIGVELGGGGGMGRNSRARASQNQPRRAEPNVIDLTLEDDDELELLGESVGESQNARRQQSQRRSNAPRLNRSDGSYVGNQNVIELSSDDENDNTVAATRARRAPPAHLHHNNHQNRNRHQHQHQHQHNNFHRINIGAIPAMAARNHNERFAQFLMGIGGDVNNAANDHNVLGMNVRPPGFPPNLHLDYQAVAFAAQPRPAPQPAAGPRKPDHDPPSKPRDGFTRDTNEDNVVICPSCDEELAFDPDGGDENGPPTKRARNKKDQAEHHFWAIKECGHVFCRRCYENRKPTAKNPVKVGFKACPSNGKRIICAVDNCTSDVTTKTSWVGLFL
ncbi:hypothetical protein PFICI_12702 [Pestalotiopsis fici W106-1]|uniref:RING-type domain-containing protein n=1 Tax=Pestalotiopsis fici (strain W106-1 / CGMCC3.15140) TaxID=1229662 RepID=W3WPI1_PESFW|nr:uncharacterized protein PFICI_12702 [Pestalotiopsis fici W106-1]ETS75758.1 hypothetical protein PFICI_12702 [Pestalotiopsis fici W106-1]